MNNRWIIDDAVFLKRMNCSYYDIVLWIEGWSTHEHFPSAKARGIQDGLSVILVRPRVRACECCELISVLINE